jgi:hypothetical protein
MQVYLPAAKIISKYLMDPSMMANDSDDDRFSLEEKPSFADRFVDSVKDTARDMIFGIASSLENKLCDSCNGRPPTDIWNCCGMKSNVCSKCQIVYRKQHDCIVSRRDDKHRQLKRQNESYHHLLTNSMDNLIGDRDDIVTTLVSQKKLLEQQIDIHKKIIEGKEKQMLETSVKMGETVAGFEIAVAERDAKISLLQSRLDKNKAKKAAASSSNSTVKAKVVTR